MLSGLMLTWEFLMVNDRRAELSSQEESISHSAVQLGWEGVLPHDGTPSVTASMSLSPSGTIHITFLLAYSLVTLAFVLAGMLFP